MKSGKAECVDLASLLLRPVHLVSLHRPLSPALAPSVGMPAFEPAYRGRTVAWEPFLTKDLFSATELARFAAYATAEVANLAEYALAVLKRLWLLP